MSNFKKIIAKILIFSLSLVNCVFAIFILSTGWDGCSLWLLGVGMGGIFGCVGLIGIIISLIPNKLPPKILFYSFFFFFVIIIASSFKDTFLLRGHDCYDLQQESLNSRDVETNTETTDDINKNQNKNDATENKEEFELNSDFVSSVLIMKAFAGDGDEVKIKSLDKSGIFHDIKEYNRMLPRGLSSLNYLNYEPTIFMSGIGENGYTTIDLSGKETSADHIFLKDKKFSEENFIKFPNEDKIVYTLESYNQGESKSVFIFDYKKNDIDYIESDILPNSPGSSRVVGLSKDKQFIYITRIGWEGYEYAGLWKVNIKTKNIDKITGAEKVTLGELNVVPYLDLAVGIESREITNDNSDVYNIMAGPPSKLNIFDLKTNNYKTLLTSNNSVLSSPILSPSGNKIFYNEENSNNLYTINTDGSNKKLIAKNANLQGVSRNGEKIIIKLVAENIFKILDLEKNSEEIITFSELTNETKAEFLLCNYPLGYSCLY